MDSEGKKNQTNPNRRIFALGDTGLNVVLEIDSDNDVCLRWQSASVGQYLMASRGQIKLVEKLFPNLYTTVPAKDPAVEAAPEVID